MKLVITNKGLMIELAVVILFLTIGTLIFRITDLDLQIQRVFFTEEDGWFLSELPMVKFIYAYSNIPALIIAVLSLLALALGFSLQRLVIYRKIALLLVLVMVIGPGIIVNSILKDHWGRPRPRNVTEFEGTMEYLKVGEKGIAGKAKSFPCGHASMGFYFFTLYFILRSKLRQLALLFLGIALIGGTGIGLVRMIQGGHFASDVLWTGGLVYLTSLGTYYLLKMDKSIYWESNILIFSRSVTIGLMFLVPLIIYYVLIATPYYSKKTIYIELDDTKYHDMNFIFEVGTVNLAPADSVFYQYEAIGFAFPGGKIVPEMSKVASNDTTYYDIKLKKQGFFGEINNEINLFIKESPFISYTGNICQLNEN